MNLSHSRTRRHGLVAALALLLGASVLVAAAPAQAAGRSLSLTPSTGLAAAGTAISFSGKLTSSPKGSTVRIQRKSGAKWLTAGTGRTTTAGGAYSVRVVLPTTAGTYTYRAYAPKRGTKKAIATGGLKIVALTPARVSLTAPASIFIGDSAKLTGTVKPFVAGTNVIFQRLAGSTWVTISNLYPSSAGAFTATVTPTVATTYRVVSPRRGSIATGVSASRTVTIKTATSWTSLAAGNRNTCGIHAADHTAWCWGNNLFGQNGNATNVGTNDTNATPAKVGTATDWSSLDLGDGSVCGLRAGTIWCWGSNQYGQLGNATNSGTTTANPTPTQVGTDDTWSDLSVGDHHACAVKTAGTLWCWGLNSRAQLGNATHVGTTTANPTPTQVGVATNWASVSAGSNYTCAITTTGTLWCWGDNDKGQLGDPNTSGLVSPVTAPIKIGTDTTWKTVAAGLENTCATKTDGTVWCFGLNDVGQGGNSTNNGNPDQGNPIPAKVGTATTWSTIATSNHSCSVRTDSTAWCWGYNFHGELGTGTAATAATDATAIPGQVLGGANWASIVSGVDHTCGIKTDGSGWCWGANSYGELGNSAPAAGPNATPLRIG